LLIPAPPISTLFPYTTLFRSEEEIGSPHFAEFIAKYKGRLSGESAIWEFGGLDYDDRPLVTLGLKGMLYVEFKVQTALKDSHSRSEEHTSELQSRSDLVCRLL